MKRLFDILLSIPLIFIGFFICLPIYLAISVTMGPPVFFKQIRPGLNSKPFNLLKFRTMKNAYDQQGRLLPDKQRITGLGKFLRKTSLDELPQLINVLKGDMSFVGPRPLLMEYLPLYNAEQARRHEVKPGITGWAQVNGRNTISWEQKFKLDVWYVDHQSFWLDMKILWLTFLKVIKRSDVNQSEQVTMEKFTGNQ